MSPEDAPAQAPTGTTPPAANAPAERAPRWLRGALVSLAIYLLGVAAVLALLLGSLGWLLTTEAGTAWLLARVPGVQIEGVHGTLFGDFDARSVTLALPGQRARLRLLELGWRRPRLQAAGPSQWFRIAFDELHASQIEWHPSDEPSTDVEPPRGLALPIGLDVGLLRVGELRIDGVDTPLRDLRARLELGADDGAQHRIYDLAARWDRLSLKGRGAVATHDPLDVQAALELDRTGEGEWAAQAHVSGPLAAPRLQVQVRAPETARRPAQTLDASAELKPFARWPLGELTASARAFDLSALHSAAPSTALDLDASARTQALDLPASVSVQLHNRAAGRWNEGRLPLRQLRLELRARPDDPQQLELPTFEAELGTEQGSAGRIDGSGHYAPTGWRLATRLATLQPALLDARAPQMQLAGQLQIEGSGFDAGLSERTRVQLRGQLEGRLLGRGPAQPVQVRLDAQLGTLRIEVRELLAQAGAARATLSGQLQRPRASAAWSVRGQAALQEFDPQPWWPGRVDTPWRSGPNRLNGEASVDVTLAPGAPGAPGAAALQQLAQMRGEARLHLQPSQLAGVPLHGSLSLQSAAPTLGQVQLQLDAAGNQLALQARLGDAHNGAGDHWDLKAELSALDRLQPLWRWLRGGDEERLSGTLRVKAAVDGRWPALRSSGELEASALQIAGVGARHAQARWTLGSAGDAPLEASIGLTGLVAGKPVAETMQIDLHGTWADHMLDARADAKALPPAWVERVQPDPGGQAATRTLARLQLQGSALGSPAQGLDGWSGRLRTAELRGDGAGAPPWLRVGEVAVSVEAAGGPLRVKVEAGRADLLGARLNWNRIAWVAADPGRAPAQLDAEAALEPLDIAPLLARVNPGFGWGGDLRIQGHLKVRSAPEFSADIAVERSAGDLSVTDDAGTRWLGLSDLRVGLAASGGVWSFSAGLAGKTFGQAAGAVVARTSPRDSWPAADAPLQGVLELQIADLGVWGPWLPPGWRLVGALHAGLSFGGRFGAPEYVGELTGQRLGVRNPLQGVDVHDGEVVIKLLGDSARIERFSANAGAGRLSLEGGASFGANPRADLQLQLDKFQLLGRVDRRIVTSGEARLGLGSDTLALDGDFTVDEGLIDFSRSDAPTLSADVQVVRGEAAGNEIVAPEATDSASVARARKTSLNLRVQLGEKLRLRGQGLDTGLRGELRMSAPSGRLRVDGSVRTVGGTYRAYRQRLNIERGVLTFNGPLENPQLDIQAIRPNLDVRVGVSVTGTVLVPRVRLFSEPEMSDADKLSWLLRGRASEGQGTADTALLQAAALALLSGDEPNALDQLFNVIGLDDLSVRQSDNATGGAIVSVGKQLSRNWYVGYERGLNATTGNWQLIYRIAQRFTIRAQSGESNSIELIWSWRWQ